MLWNSRLWSGCIGITTPARIRTVKTLLQCSSRITTILKSVGQRWLAYRQELSTELGAIQLSGESGAIRSIRLPAHDSIGGGDHAPTCTQRQFKCLFELFASIFSGAVQ